MSIIRSIKDAAWVAIHKNRRHPVVARIAMFCKNIHRASEHPGHDVMVNGERDCLLRAVSSQTPVVLDVGANVGDWSAMCGDLFPGAAIHAFELSPETAVRLGERFQNRANIHAHPFGLSSAAGAVDFFAYEGEASVLSGLRSAIWSHPHTVQKADVRTGDQFCEEEKIDGIDFLKIDAEGFDYEVLLGFKKMLSGGKVRVLQFEMEGGRYLKDFYDLLTPQGYEIGKLYANYVDFLPHTVELESFLGPNYIAVRGDLGELRDRLKKGW